MSDSPIPVQALTASQVLGGWMQNAVAHPRSTISGFLSTGLATIGFLLACGCLNVKVAAWLFGLNGIMKLAWAAFAMRDPGSTLAVVPGQATPQMVPAHEVPNNPLATPATKVGA